MLNKIKEIESKIFYLVILLLPTQFGRHFWPEFSFVQGLRIDYLSPTLYLTDILIISLLAIFLLRKFLFKDQLKTLFFTKKPWVIVWSFSIIAGIIISKNPSAGFYGLVKAVEFVFFGYYTAKVLAQEKVFKNILICFSIGIVIEGLLAIAQFLNQGSIGGIFYYFGERAFNGQTPGIANVSLAGEMFVRPYATFSHPNVLAAYLLISATFLLFAVLNLKSLKRKEKAFYSFLFFLGSAVLLLTMSRVAILLLLLIIIYLVIKKLNKKAYLLVIIILLIIFLSPLRFRFFEFSFSELAWVQRVELINSAFLMSKDHFFLGVGLNNFLTNLPNYQLATNFYLQPVHNIYLLIFAQTGVIGLGFFVYFLKKTIVVIKKEKKYKGSFLLKTTLLTVVLMLGFFDHYFLTLQQGQILLSFMLGFAWARLKYLV